MAIVEQVQNSGVGRRVLRLSSPATLAPVGEIEVQTAADVRAAVERARKAQPEWGALSFEERGRYLERAVRVILEPRTALLGAAACAAALENGPTRTPKRTARKGRG